MRPFLKLAALAAIACLASPAFANPCPPGNPPTNCGPPSGNVIFDLAGQLLPHQYTLYTTSFVASGTSTNLTFAFREDPAFFQLDDVAVTTGGGPNIVVNPGFESGGLLPGWTALNSFGAADAGVIDNGHPHTGTFAWDDGAVQGYDALTQILATTIGLTYNVSFWLNDDGSLRVAQQLSTNGNTTNTGGNGADVLVYAGAIPHQGVPEPASLGLLGLGFGLVGLMLRRRTS